MSTAKNLLSRVGKPSSDEAKTLAKLFPSSASSTKSKIKFDPHAACVATNSHLKKK